MNPLGLVVVVLGAVWCALAVGLSSELALGAVGLAAGLITLVFGDGR